MKIVMTFKDSDCGQTPSNETLSIKHQEKINKLKEKFFEYGEYCNIEFDLDTGTAKVLKVNE